MARMSASPSDQSDAALYRLKAARLESLCRRRSDEFGCHGWEHVARVRALAAAIGALEGADPAVVDASALFHDTMRSEEDHALAGARFAESTLLREGFSPAFAAAVYGAVSSHSFSAGRPAGTIEAKVLADADRLDAMGAIGIYRTVQYNLEHGFPAARVAAHIRGKLLNLPALMHTASARGMAMARLPALQSYLSALESELLDASSSR
jgi:uncharacterized protein